MNNNIREFENDQTRNVEIEDNFVEAIIPVIEEDVQITKKVIDIAQVNISKTVNESTETFQIPLSSEEIVVKRIPINEYVDTMPPASRYEGETMIIPVLKEVAVIEKRMMLVEEIHVSKLKTENIETVDVLVKKEEVNVTRTEL